MAVENGAKLAEDHHHGRKEAEEAVKVKVTQTSRVNMDPTATKLCDMPSTYPLATFDLPYITFYYNQKLLLYKLPQGSRSEFEEAVARLKEGLGAVLQHFPPLAGRIRQEADGALVVVVAADGEEEEKGVEVLEAEAEGLEVAGLAQGVTAGASLVLQELVPYTGVMNLEGFHRPLLAVQFTKLKDGLAVGCAFNHAILDGHSTWHFMTSWAQLCLDSSATIAAPPLLDRTKARSTRVKVDLPASPRAHELADPNGPPKPLVARIFSFPEPTLAKLKSAANNSGPGPAPAKPFSTFQSLGAHVWRAVSRARNLRPEDITVFAIFINCRARVDPMLPDAYFGNLIQAIFTGTAAGLLAAGPSTSVAGLLQKTIDAHDAAAIAARLEQYEAAPKMFHYTDAGVNCVAVGSSPRFRVYDVDFGFGRPERVGSGSNNKFDGMMYLYPGREGDGSIDVELTLDADAMENLEKDDSFLNV